MWSLICDKIVLHHDEKMREENNEKIIDDFFRDESLKAKEAK